MQLPMILFVLCDDTRLCYLCFSARRPCDWNGSQVSPVVRQSMRAILSELQTPRLIVKGPPRQVEKAVGAKAWSISEGLSPAYRTHAGDRGRANETVASQPRLPPTEMVASQLVSSNGLYAQSVKSRRRELMSSSSCCKSSSEILSLSEGTSVFASSASPGQSVTAESVSYVSHAHLIRKPYPAGYPRSDSAPARS